MSNNRRNSAARKKAESAKPTSQTQTVETPTTEKLVTKTSATEKESPSRWLTVILPIAAIFISLASAVNSIYQTVETRKIYRAHVRPGVECVVRHSSLPQFKDEKFAPELVVWNNGPIKAVSVCVSYRVFVVNPDTLEVPASIGITEDLLDYSIVEPELAVGQRIGKTILGGDTLTAYVVNTVYYRESDMEKFSREDFFFYDSGAFHNYEGFKARKGFETIMKNLQLKMRAEALKPTSADRQMPPAMPGASHVNINVGTLSKDGSWTNPAGTNPITITPLFEPSTNH